MKRVLLGTIILFVWLFASNHCAFEVASGLACTCSDSESASPADKNSCTGSPCFTAKSTLPHPSQLVVKKIEILREIPLVVWGDTRLNDSVPTKPTLLDAPWEFESRSLLLLTSLASASNAPPVI